jgi:hydroxypyruvate isomerase
VERRDFLKKTTLTAAGLAALSANGQAADVNSKKPFKLNYAPHFGMFKNSAGKDHIDQLKFMYDHGFRSIEDNGMMNRPIELQEKIASTMGKLGMKMGVFVAYAEFKKETFVHKDDDFREWIINRMKKAVDTAKRVNAKWCTVVPAVYSQGLEWGYQTANVIDNLKYCADVCEKSGLIMVIEPLNNWINHPGLFLTKIPQAYQICKAVNSPSCKILDDLYHQQISEGNLIPNMDIAWDEIAYFQIGDNPGRKEPTTGEVNFRNVFKHIYEKGYKGVLGMEHGNSRPGKEGELAVIEAYRKSDDF